MNTDRRILAWLAILISLVCCTPLACGSGFMAFAGGLTYFDPERYWDNSDAFLLGVMSVLLIAFVAVGLLLVGWGVMSLLKRDSSSDTEPLDTSQDIIG